MDNLLAVILAGGKGKRMDILCEIRPKPLMPFGGRYRVIDFCLSNIMHSRIDDTAVFVDYQRHQLAEYIKCWQDVNAIAPGVNVMEPRTGRYTGSANALYQHLDFLTNSRADKILVMPSDHVYKMDYREMLDFHQKSKAEVTIGVVQVPMREASRFGILSTANDGKVLEFNEKPSKPKSNLASMGIYIFNKDILLDYLVKDASIDHSIHDFGYSIIPGTIGHAKVYAYKFDGFWRDIGNLEVYLRSNLEFLNADATISLDGEWPILTVNSVKETGEINNSNVINSIVSPGCIIKGRVENSVLSPGARVEEWATVRNSILLSNAVVRCNSTVDFSIIDEEAVIERFCYIGYSDGRQKTSDCVVIGKRATIAPYTAVERGCIILPYSRYSKSTNSIYDIADVDHSPNGNTNPIQIAAS
jgi:glucose-1-phosphate adenylyltransferase